MTAHPSCAPAAIEDHASRFVILAEGDEAETLECAIATAGHCSEGLSPAELPDAIRAGGVSVLIIAVELIAQLDPEALAEAIAVQPAWSDLPVLVLADRDQARTHDHLLDALGQVRLVERPIDHLVMQRALKAALRSRARQQGAMAVLLRLERTEAEFRALSTGLEERVAERSRQLEAAYDRLVREAEERWIAETRLRESEELYRYTVELTQQLIWTADADGVIDSLSPRFRELTGIDGDMSDAAAWGAAVHPDDLPALRRAWAEAIAQGSPASFEFRLRHRDGSYRLFSARAAARRDENRGTLRWYGTAEDVEDRRRFEEERRFAEERYRLAAHATNDAIWDYDVPNACIYWAASKAGFFGYEARDRTGLDWWEERVHPDDRERIAASLGQACVVGAEDNWSATYRFRKADGEYADVFDQGFIVRQADGTALRIVGAMADITDRVRSEAELRRVQSQLIHVSRLSAMGAMASTLAHELNQPLTAVSSYVSGCRRLMDAPGGPDVDLLRGALADAEAGAQRAGLIVRRLRELVSRGQVAAQPEDLRKLINEALAIAMVDAHLHGVEWKLLWGSGVERVLVDRIQIQQVLINLLRNAIEAVADEPRRRIVVRTGLRGGAEAMISVFDTGCGVSGVVEAALFSPFNTSKPDGMGIGLSICRTIIEAHGGKIWADKRRVRGMVFRFTLPVLAAPPPQPEDAPL